MPCGLLAMCVLLLFPSVAEAKLSSCDGPAECCPDKLADDLPTHIEVQLGVVLVGLHSVNEKNGTWDADYYLREVWPPTAGFVPQTEIVNEVSGDEPRFDTTELRGGRCVRSRRMRSTMYSPYNLRTFPFDEQHLTLQLSDAQFPSGSLSYASTPAVALLDDGAKDQLSSFRIAGGMTYERIAREFKGDEGAPVYDYATFQIAVHRHVSFHLTRFFLPLFVIVAVAFSAFWIDPEDLSSKVGIGVTCLLAAIAFQFAEADSLPQVAYLTLADRVFAICYFALALAMVVSISSNTIARRGAKARAIRVDRGARAGFPAALLLALVLGVIRAATITGN
ncbi:MAG: hypothetical protein U0441_22465 [Polyangiaceae bacterium]